MGCASLHPPYTLYFGYFILGKIANHCQKTKAAFNTKAAFFMKYFMILK
ncbi:Uncharacterized protein dnm_054710 [Desulfonema magnum]|uniref:Uncharacterized protein n=1 Tax=Desulfonema magnum TaxID=45655 RepID=A0A975BQB3_9BACT|nr:Uncharacterized protein dnm_054710 [Desulfonema magnum]